MPIQAHGVERNNEFVMEKCIEGDWCTQLETFIDHFQGNTGRKIGIDSTHLMRKGEYLDHPSLVHRMPKNKGSWTKLYFCPFCGGQISDPGSVSKKDGTILKITFDEKVRREDESKET